jgi:hypothetical protein
MTDDGGWYWVEHRFLFFWIKEQEDRGEYDQTCWVTIHFKSQSDAEKWIADQARRRYLSRKPNVKPIKPRTIKYITTQS